MLWASPECTNHSQAKGQKAAAKRDGARPLTLWEDEEERTSDASAAQRSRATMLDVVKFAAHHRYRFVIVENVVDVAKWDLFDEWLREMTNLGYEYQLVSLNSMHAPAQGGIRAPQSRDRLYVVFHRAGTPRPDVTPRPAAWCSGCEQEVRAVQVFKNGHRVGKYGPRQQYIYRCPNHRCRSQVVEPYTAPAASVIDWSNIGTRIGDKLAQARYGGLPLAPKTLERIRVGRRKFGRPVTFEAAGNTFCRTRPDGTLAYTRSWPVDQPTRALTTSETRALVCPSGGTWNDTAAPVTDPLRTRTTRETDALVIPMEGRAHPEAARQATVPLRTQTARHQDALVVPYRRTGVAHPADEPMPTMTTIDPAALAFIAELRGGGSDARHVADPLATVCASGNHHGLVSPAAGPAANVDPGRAERTLVHRHNTPRGDLAQMLTPATEPFRTLTTSGHQSLTEWEPDTGLDDDDVFDCYFRMLTTDEIGLAMAFGAKTDYLVLGTNRDVVRQYGNGVTPPAAGFLLAACRTAYDLAG